jgi:hypothetical protein
MSTTDDQTVKRVCIINKLSTANQLDLNRDILPGLRAIQTQLKNEFLKYWAVTAKLYYCPPGVTPPKDMWHMYLLDTSDIAGALGYHDANSQGIPQGKVFIGTVKKSKASWTVTLSHEIMEALVDPWGMTNFFQDYTSGMRRLVAMECCDPVEADKYGYKINDILVSNFVTPYWYHPFDDVAELDGNIKYDYKGLLNQSFKTLPGCHQSYYYISGAPKGTPINSWSSKNFQLGVEETIYAPQQNGWIVSFKTPTRDMVKQYAISKEEVLEAIDSAFSPFEGSRRDIRFKGISRIQLNDSAVHVGEKAGEVLEVDESFNT